MAIKIVSSEKNFVLIPQSNVDPSTMDSDFELVESDAEFEGGSVSSDEPLVLLSSDDEDALISASRRSARQREVDITSPPSRVTRNSKKRLREDTTEPPKPSGWIVSSRRGVTVYLDDEDSLPPKRPKLADLVEARKKARAKLEQAYSSSSMPNRNLQDDDGALIIDLSDEGDHAPSERPSRLRKGSESSSKQSSTSNTTIRGSNYTEQDLNGDEILLSDSETSATGSNSFHRNKLQKTKNGIGNNSTGAKIGSEEKDEVDSEFNSDESSSSGYESSGSSNPEEYEATSVRYERVVAAATKISMKLSQNLELNSTIPEGVPASSVLYAKPINAIIKQPEEITRQLKDYQVTGLNWLRILHLSSVNGILADEMGLGKTIQTIAFISWLKSSRAKFIENGSSGVKVKKPKTLGGAINDPSRDFMAFGDAHCDWPILVVSPASTLANWKREFETWAPHLNVLVYHGTKNEREDMKDEIKYYWRQHKQHYFDVIITTYQMVSSKYDSNFFKHGVRFHYFVVDEAQMLKGRKTMRFTHLTQIRSIRRLMLTGTPLQNNLDELHALAGFLMPNLFGKLLEFSLHHEILALKEQGKKVSESEYVTSLKQLLNPFILRRLKSQVGLGLLPKIHTIIHAHPTPVQAQLNQKLFTRSKIALKANASQLPAHPTAVDLTNEDSSDSNPEEGSSTADGSSAVIPTNKHEISQEPTDPNFILANLLMQLRKSANHPIFIRAFYSPEQLLEIANVLLSKKHKKFKNFTLAEIINDLELSSDWTLHNFCLEYPASLKHLRLSDEQLFESSGKFVALSELLPRLKAEGHRVVLFSQFTTVLDVLEQFLTRKMGYGYLRLDGNTKITDRQVRMDAFNENLNDQYFLFVASTLSGGLGVNLTSADTVIFFDMSFNPHVDRQAEDRCHRLGQSKQVTVYNLIMPGSVEEHMYRMAVSKTELNDVMLNEGSFAENEALNAFNDANTDDTTHLKQSATDEGDEAHPSYHIRRTSAELMFMEQVAKSIVAEE